MDVTSLLNAGTNPLIRRDSTPGSTILLDAAAVLAASTSLPTPTHSPDKTPSRRGSSGSGNNGSRTPNSSGGSGRNRTPWDAGGYSLPLTIDTKFAALAAAAGGATGGPTAAAAAGGRPAILYHHESCSPASSDIDVTDGGITPASSTYGGLSSSFGGRAHSRSQSMSLSGSQSRSHSHARSESMASTTGSDMGGGAPPSSATPMNAAQPRPTFPGEMETHLEISTTRSLGGESDAQLTARRPGFIGENDHHGSPKSPKHKFSDSHSSLSSYASSSRSSGACHSRISSLSTVSGIQPLVGSLLLGDVPEKSEYPPLGDLQLTSPRGGGVHPPPLYHANSSPPALGGIRALTAAEPLRPRSPSDAILITRGQSSNRSSPEDGSSTTAKPNLNFLHLPSDHSHAKSHKRAVSAPDFAAITAPSAFQPFAPVSESTPYLNPSYVMASPPESPPAGPGAAAASASATSSPAVPTEIKCMYIDNCDTGSQPRKAISHIFGRNKLCTRMIPQSVWVHFCRKHYQRSRYRNAHEYAKLQVDLVRKQVDRVQAWSDENERAGRQGVVNGWSLSVRKREAKRLEDKKDGGGSAVAGAAGAGGGNKKRGYESDEERDFDAAEANGTAVPKWLLEKCGSGYSTPQVQEIVALLRDAIDSSELTQIPDIEILPSITGESDSESKPKTHVKRKSSAGGGINTHKRSQSMGVALRPEMLPIAARRVSQPHNYWPGHEAADSTVPAEKRQRLADLEGPLGGGGDYYGRRTLPGMGGLPGLPPPPLPRAGDRAMPSSMRRIHQLPHRPAFGNIRESQSEDGYFAEHAGHQQQQQRPAPLVFGGSPPGGPLPAPTPQRATDANTSLASRLEPAGPSSMYSYGRPSHQRSHSEMMGSYASQAPPAYRPSSSSGYAAPPAPYPYGPSQQPQHSQYPQHQHGAEHQQHPQQHEQNAFDPAAQHGYPPRQETGFATGGPAGPPAYYDDIAPRGSYGYGNAPGPSSFQPLTSGPRHSRHQSTPNAGRAMMPMPSHYQHHHQHTQSSASSGAQAYGGPREYDHAAPPAGASHSRQASYAAPAMMVPRTVVEDESAKSVYSRR